MRVIEAEAKALLARRGIAVPEGGAIYRAGETMPAGQHPVAVKAQTLSGKRAEAGLVVLTSGAEAPAAVARIHAAMSALGEQPIVLVEGKADIATEYYLAWRIDDLQQRYALMFSSVGGSNIEERPDTIRQYFHSPLVEMQPYQLAGFLADAGVPAGNVGAVARFAVSLFEVFRGEDALLLEINPLVITKKGKVVAVDAKLVYDDNAEKRHLDWQSLISASLQLGEQTALEAEASEAGFTFVELDGSIAVFSSGAGLGMCLLDMLADVGLPAANFSDASGGSAPAVFAHMGQVVLEMAKRDEVKGILFFFVLTATSLKSVMDGILYLTSTVKPPKPLVIGLIAGGAAERELTLKAAQELINERGYGCATDLTAAVKAVRLAVA